MDVGEIVDFLDELAEIDAFRSGVVLAERAHGHQLYGDRPYIFHLAHVASLAREYDHGTTTWLLAALFHDIVEDTDVTLEKIAANYSPAVAQLVDAVTGHNSGRKEHVAVQRAKIEKLPAAARLKCWDRMSHFINLGDHYGENPEKYGRLLSMYDREQPEFLDMLRGRVPELMVADLEDHRRHALAVQAQWLAEAKRAVA